MVRCPVIVGVTTSSPTGHLFDPREAKVTSEPGAVAIESRSANQARSDTSEDSEALDG